MFVYMATPLHSHTTYPSHHTIPPQNVYIISPHNARFTLQTIPRNTVHFTLQTVPPNTMHHAASYHTIPYNTAHHTLHFLHTIKSNIPHTIPPHTTHMVHIYKHTFPYPLTNMLWLYLLWKPYSYLVSWCVRHFKDFLCSVE